MSHSIEREWLVENTLKVTVAKERARKSSIKKKRFVDTSTHAELAIMIFSYRLLLQRIVKLHLVLRYVSRYL